MDLTSKQPIVIVGAGIAGCFLALLLANRGYKVRIIEKYSRKDMINNTSNRTFNITLYGYGLSILKQAGLWNTLKKHVLPLLGSVTQVNNNTKPIHTDLNPIKRPYFAIQRASLIEVLLEKADKNELITVQFGYELKSINKKNKTIKIESLRKKKSTIFYNVLFGADGIHSVVRQYLQKEKDSYHVQEYAKWSYKQITFTKDAVEKLGLHLNKAYTWTRKNAVIATFPNVDGTITATLIIPKNKWLTLATPHAIKSFINKNFTGLLPIIDVITSALMKNPEGGFVTIHTSPWHYEGSIAILGDSAHGFYPFFGQGISAALGDCVTITKILEQQEGDWARTLQLYESKRKIHMDAMGELSKEGFNLYRRSRKANYPTIYNKLEDILNGLFPKYIQPSIFTSIVADPENTAEYVKRHNHQRQIARYFGLPVIIAATTILVRVYEDIRNIFTASRYYQTLI